MLGNLIRYWANFAHGGDPNGAELPPWNRFDNARSVPHVQSSRQERMASRSVDYAAEHQLDFWSELS